MAIFASTKRRERKGEMPLTITIFWVKLISFNIPETQLQTG